MLKLWSRMFASVFGLFFFISLFLFTHGFCQSCGQSCDPGTKQGLINQYPQCAQILNQCGSFGNASCWAENLQQTTIGPSNSATYKVSGVLLIDNSNNVFCSKLISYVQCCSQWQNSVWSWNGPMSINAYQQTASNFVQNNPIDGFEGRLMDSWTPYSKQPSCSNQGEFSCASNPDSPCCSGYSPGLAAGGAVLDNANEMADSSTLTNPYTSQSGSNWSNM